VIKQLALHLYLIILGRPGQWRACNPIEQINRATSDHVVEYIEGRSPNLKHCQEDN